VPFKTHFLSFLKAQFYLNYIFGQLSSYSKNTLAACIHHINRVVNAVQVKIVVYCGIYKKQIHTICGHKAADLTVTTEGLKWPINHLSLVDTSCNTRLKFKTVCFLPANLFTYFMWISEEAAVSSYLILTESF